MAAVRHYYIAAEDVNWDFAPSGQNLLNGKPIPPPWSRGTVWKKTRYIEYTDSTFTLRKPQPEWLGILGPIIRAEVGDSIVVEFLNRTHAPHSIHPHGLRYSKNDEGALYLPSGRGSQVPPGGRFVYHWFADKQSGPGPGQPSSIVWWYHSHIDPVREINSGLIGPIIVTAKGKGRDDASPKNVDREFIAAFMVFDQMQGKPEGLFYAINGYIFGNLPGLNMKMGDKVRWYLMGMGNEIDLHTPHWHGEKVRFEQRNVDVVELLPASTATVDMLADNPGTWMFHCHVEEHMESGMIATYTIYSPSTRSCPLRITRGEFWNSDSQMFSLQIENTSAKPIKSALLTAYNLLAPNYLRQPYINSQWRTDEPIPPHGSVPIRREGYRKSFRDKIMAWIFAPTSISYSDGTNWTSRQYGECFQTLWRDAEHPTLEVLPTLQFETNDD